MWVCGLGDSRWALGSRSHGWWASLHAGWSLQVTPHNGVVASGMAAEDPGALGPMGGLQAAQHARRALQVSDVT